MEKIKTFADLKKRRDSLQSCLQLREMGDNVDSLIQVKVAMGTCGIASGAKQTMEAIINECQKQNVAAVITQTNCMGHCDAEPTIEVVKPGMAPVVFGHMTSDKAAELVSKYLVGNTLIDGVIPCNK